MTKLGRRRGSRSANGIRSVSYDFFHLDDAGRVVVREDRDCKGDVAALVYARTLAPYRAIEIWDGAFRVAHIAKGEDPLDVYDSTSGWHWSFPAERIEA